jgi:hypothetical protein
MSTSFRPHRGAVDEGPRGVIRRPPIPGKKAAKEHMNEPERVNQIIFRALESLNAELPEESKIPVGVETPLFGEKAALDSLSLVSVIIDVETAVADELGRPVSLTDDRALNQPVSPFSDVKALSSYILVLLAEKA